jgi:hypothetical protein
MKIFLRLLAFIKTSYNNSLWHTSGIAKGCEGGLLFSALMTKYSSASYTSAITLWTSSWQQSLVWHRALHAILIIG